MLNILEHVDIREHTTFKVGGQFRYFVELTNTEELAEAYKFAQEKNLPVLILGGGSNMVFADGVIERLVIKIKFEGFEIINDTSEYSDIKIGAGENWDSVVARSVEMNLSGIEAMSAIPGTAGATPVQNVGAYGQEISQTLITVEVFDVNDSKIKILPNADCGFSYRDSIFKHEGKGKYVICSITLRLSKTQGQMPNYPGVKKYFDEKGINNPSLSDIRQAIIAIRNFKLPDPKSIPSVGSFFKNPIISKEVADKLKNDYSQLTLFPIDDSYTKVPAGFLIETAGLKDKSFGTISTYKNNALVLVNNGGATRADVDRVKNEIIETVKTKFGITLEPEPEFI